MSRTFLIDAAVLAVTSFSAFAQIPPQQPYGPPPTYGYGPPQAEAPYSPAPPYNNESASSYSYGPPMPYGQPAAAAQSARISPQELSNLVAPIALFPDMLLSQVLAASTYPAEIMEAQRWMQANPGLRGQQLVDAAKQQNWDPSVQALVAFPDVMNLLTRDIQWTTALGNTFLSQQADLMDAIQRLRAAAQQNGRLTNTPQQRVMYEQQNGQDAIAIQPTDPQMVYPPLYNPDYVWGAPAYGAYPPLAYPPSGDGILYGVGAFLGGLFSGFLSFGGWGWGLSWLGHGLFLNNLFFSHFGFHGGGYGSYGGYGGGYGYAARSPWVHNPGHRLGVPYGNGYGGARYAGAYGGGAWNRFNSQSYRGNYTARDYNSGRSGYGASDSYRGGRQMEAYRALSQSGSRGAAAYGSNYGGSYRGGGAWASGGRYSSAANYGARGYGGGYSARSSSAREWSTPASYRNSERSSHGGFFSSHSSGPKFSAPKSSGHFGGGGGHSRGGGGHSHGGSHRK